MSVGEKSTILIVEDEFLVRMAAVDLVEEAGFLALEAGNADEAIAILEERPDVRLVLTDIDKDGDASSAGEAGTPRNAAILMRQKLQGVNRL